ncbi:MAG: hypothetical protein EOO27_14805 [Comamonadaceae bacterium]|nr:MAG: hypothetical protein EOO27_14805 [Comamonadaceae bacterium]
MQGRGITVREFGTDAGKHCDYSRLCSCGSSLHPSQRDRAGNPHVWNWRRDVHRGEQALGGSRGGLQRASERTHGAAAQRCNVLRLSARIIGTGTALDIVDAFLNGVFEGGRHSSRIEKINFA